MTAREIQEAFEKYRLGQKLSGNPMALLYMRELPQFFVEHPEWLAQRCNASAICEMHISLLIHCLDNESLLAMIIEADEKLRNLLQEASTSHARTAKVREGASLGVNEEVVQAICRLNRAIVEYQALTAKKEAALFVERRASQRVVAWLMRGELTFRKVIERSPHLLLVSWLDD